MGNKAENPTQEILKPGTMNADRDYGHVEKKDRKEFDFNEFFEDAVYPKMVEAKNYVKGKVSQVGPYMKEKITELKKKRSKSVEPTKENVSLQNSNSESSFNGIKKFFKRDENVVKVPALPKPAPEPKKELTLQEKLEGKLHKTENYLLLIRLLGSFILTWDITVKVAYYYNSRFASQMLK